MCTEMATYQASHLQPGVVDREHYLPIRTNCWAHSEPRKLSSPTPRPGSNQDVTRVLHQHKSWPL